MDNDSLIMGMISFTIGISIFIFVCIVSGALFINYPSQLSDWFAGLLLSFFTMLIYFPLCLAGLLLGIAGRISRKRDFAITGAVLCAVCFIALPLVMSLRH
jgi:hypothetical protein